MRLRRHARVAVVGAGPSGILAAKYALEAGFDATVFEASDDLGGQWHATAGHSGIWPGMRTNTSRAMTAFSDAPAPADHPLHPTAEQIHAYLRAYADRFGVSERIRTRAPVARLAPGWDVDGERFDAVVVASGRFRKPRLPAGLADFGGELIHSFAYPGAEPFRDRRTLVYGNGISGLEIAADLADVAPVVSAARKPRYVIQKVVEGIPSDWQWYTAFGALERRHLDRAELGRTLRERVLRVAGNPASFGAPEPDPDVLIAGLSLCQDYLTHVAAGRIECRPAIAAVRGRDITFTDGSREQVDAIVCATGYDLDIPYLDPRLWEVLGPELALYRRTIHPDIPGFGVVGQFFAQGPYFPLLELQARWIVAIWAGDVATPDPQAMRGAVTEPPPVDPHNVLATALADELGVAPDLLARPELTEALIFGPLLPPRYRFDGPGARPDAPARFAEQLAQSPRPPVDPIDIEALGRFGLGDTAAAMSLAARASLRTGPTARGETMPDHRTGTREEWQAARGELASLEAEHGALGRKLVEQRRQLPWVAVEKEYEFDTEDGRKTLAELFDGRSQLLAYNIMFGPDYEVGACPGCSNLGDELSATSVHLNHRDVTLICFSRAPIDRLVAYRKRMGWEFPYVSTNGSDFPFDFGLALTPEQAQGVPEIQQMVGDPPGWLAEWGQQVGAKLEDGLRENPSFIAFARENGTVFHTYTVSAPDPFVAPYHSFLLQRTAKDQPDEPRAWRKDEYPD